MSPPTAAHPAAPATTMVDAAYAREAALQVAEMLRLGFWAIAGDLRRDQRRVDNIVILTPRPQGGPGEPDLLHARLSRVLEEGGLCGRADSGLQEGFRHCRLFLSSVNGKSCLRVELVRYDDGAAVSNRGYALLRWTGPADYVLSFYRRWREVHAIAAAGRTSIDGHLVDAAGVPVECATEVETFERAGVLWQEPRHRGLEVVIGQWVGKATGGRAA